MDQAAWIGNAINSDVSSGAITGSSPSFGRYCVAVAEAAAFFRCKRVFFLPHSFFCLKHAFFSPHVFFPHRGWFFSPQVFFMFPKKMCLSFKSDRWFANGPR